SAAVRAGVRHAGDHRGAPSIMPPVIVLHRAGIGHHSRGRDRREQSAEIQRVAAEEAPFLAFAIEAVHVEHGRLPEEARNPGDRTVRDVADQDYLSCSERNVNQREKRMEGGVEVLPGNGGQNDTLNARSYIVVRSCKGAAAVYSDFVAPGRQASRKVFGERFKSAVARRNATRAQYGNFHRASVLRQLEVFKANWRSTSAYARSA